MMPWRRSSAGVRAVIARGVLVGRLHRGPEPLIEVRLDAQVVARDLANLLLAHAGGLLQLRELRGRSDVRLEHVDLTVQARRVGLGWRKARDFVQHEVPLDQLPQRREHRVHACRRLHDPECDCGLGIRERDRLAIHPRQHTIEHDLR
jgi:hypothetical protein